MAPLTPLQVRKQLLVATSTLQRAQLGRTLGQLEDVARGAAQAAGRQAKTVATLVSGLGLFYSLLSPFRRRAATPPKPSAREGGREANRREGAESWMSQVLAMARTAVALWLTLRPLLRPVDPERSGKSR